MLFYSLSDVTSLSLTLSLSALFLFKEFGLNLLNFGSVSRFSYEILLKESERKYGGLGLSYVNSYEMYEKW